MFEFNFLTNYWLFSPNRYRVINLNAIGFVTFKIIFFEPFCQLSSCKIHLFVTIDPKIFIIHKLAIQLFAEVVLQMEVGYVIVVVIVIVMPNESNCEWAWVLSQEKLLKIKSTAFSFTNKSNLLYRLAELLQIFRTIVVDGKKPWLGGISFLRSKPVHAKIDPGLDCRLIMLFKTKINS